MRKNPGKKNLFTHLKRHFGYLTLALGEVGKSALANQKEMGIQGTQHTVTTRSRAGMSVFQQALADMLEGKQNPGTQLLAEHWWKIHRRAQKLVPTGEKDANGHPIMREETEAERLARWQQQAGPLHADYGPVVLWHEVKEQVDIRGTITSGTEEQERVVERLEDGTEIFSDGTRQDERLLKKHLNVYIEHEATHTLFPLNLCSQVLVRQANTAQSGAERLLEFVFDGDACEDISLLLLLSGDLPLEAIGRVSLVTETDAGMELISYQTRPETMRICHESERGWIIISAEGHEELARSVSHG